jgi:hypothetical protein
MIFWISLVSIMNPLFCLWFFLIWVYSFLLLIWLKISQRNNSFCFIDLLYYSFGLQSLISAMIYIISFHLLLLGLYCSCSKSLKCIIRLFTWDLIFWCGHSSEQSLLKLPLLCPTGSSKLCSHFHLNLGIS